MMILEKYINLLKEMIAIESLSREESPRADFLEQWILKEGMQVHRENNNLLITTDGDITGKKLLLNSHIDTVSPVDGWTTDPYKPLDENGRITGLGTNDAGASVIAMLAAFTELDSRGKANDLLLLLSAEEEISGSNGLESQLPLLNKMEFAIIGEPTQMQPAVAERGLMVIDAFAEGKSGHAARNEGVNAIYKAMEDLEGIRALKFSKPSNWLPEPSVNVTMINSGINHNVVPDKCHFVIDARSNDRYSNSYLLEIIKRACTSELKPRSIRLNSSYLDSKHPVFQVIIDMGLSPFGSSTMSDMALLSIPAIKIGPGESARSHTAGEYILVKEINDGIEKYLQLIPGILDLKELGV